MKENAVNPGTNAINVNTPNVDPEVPQVAKRRRFTAAYKLEVLAKADRCIAAGEVGALLRKEGLYSSHLATWRRERDRGAAAALSKKRGRKPAAKDPFADELHKLQRENRALRERLERAELIIDIQKKVSAALGIPLNPGNDEGGV
jgi:transposase